MNQDASRVFVEVCVGSVADVEAALAGGADRLELCGALELGGLTPSLGLVEKVLEVSPLPVLVMLRPRAGGFYYDRHEFDAMLRDGERLLELGASGLVFGVLDGEARVDAARSREIVQLARGRQTVFQRAFDFVPDQREATDSLIDLGCTRVLTSGGKPTAEEGADAIRAIVLYAAERIEVMAGGSIRADNVAQVVQRTKCTQVHIGGSAARLDDSAAAAPSIELCDARFLRGTAHRVVSVDAVAATVAALRADARTSDYRGGLVKEA